MFQIDPKRKDLIAEFKARPLGPHSPELQAVLNLMRTEPMTGRWVLVEIERKGGQRKFCLGRLAGARGEPVEILTDGPHFTDANAAEWEVFRRRWEKLTGEALAP
jgi:hypothetical protein